MVHGELVFRIDLKSVQSNGVIGTFAMRREILNRLRFVDSARSNKLVVSERVSYMRVSILKVGSLS